MAQYLHRTVISLKMVVRVTSWIITRHGHLATGHLQYLSKLVATSIALKALQAFGKGDVQKIADDQHSQLVGHKGLHIQVQKPPVQVQYTILHCQAKVI